MSRGYDNCKYLARAVELAKILPLKWRVLAAANPALDVIGVYIILTLHVWHAHKDAHGNHRQV